MPNPQNETMCDRCHVGVVCVHLTRIMAEATVTENLCEACASGAGVETSMLHAPRPELPDEPTSA